MKYEVIFFGDFNEAILFGNVSKLYFDTEDDTMEFIDKVEVKGCKEILVTVYDTEGWMVDMYSYEIIQ